MPSNYYAVIFTSLQSPHTNGYAEMAEAMEILAKKQHGFLGLEHAKSEIGITISYWKSMEAIANWKANLDHLEAQNLGKEKWYTWYKVRVCKVERAYEFSQHR